MRLEEVKEEFKPLFKLWKIDESDLDKDRFLKALIEKFAFHHILTSALIEIRVEILSILNNLSNEEKNREFNISKQRLQHFIYSLVCKDGELVLKYLSSIPKKLLSLHNYDYKSLKTYLLLSRYNEVIKTGYGIIITAYTKGNVDIKELMTTMIWIEQTHFLLSFAQGEMSGYWLGRITEKERRDKKRIENIGKKRRERIEKVKDIQKKLFMYPEELKHYTRATIIQKEWKKIYHELYTTRTFVDYLKSIEETEQNKENGKR